MFTRKLETLRSTPTCITLLFGKDFLPVSLDYRLCPEVPLAEVTLLAGPVTDYLLSNFRGRGSESRAKKIVVVGWSSGGQLVMSLAWTTTQRGLSPPEAMLIFMPLPITRTNGGRIRSSPTALYTRASDTMSSRASGTSPSPITRWWERGRSQFRVRAIRATRAATLCCTSMESTNSTRHYERVA